MSSTEPNLRVFWSRARSLVSLALLSLIAGCASLGSDAGMRVAGDATTVDVTWDELHPWAQQLHRQAAQWHLYAQYRVEQKPFEQDLGAAEERRAEGWQFHLPARLTRVPEGSVCLFIGDARKGSGLPIRLHAAVGSDTAHFRNAAWESAVTRATLRAQRQREAEALDKSAQQLADTLIAAREALHSKGTESPSDCEQIALRNQDVTPGAASAQVVTPPEQQAATARRICVRRARNMRRRHLDNGEGLLDMERFIGDIRTQGILAPNDRLTPLADAFLRDWSTWYERTGAEYIPELGAEDALLPMGDVLEGRLAAWIEAGRHADGQALRELAGGLLDAYGACLEDVTKQLVVTYQESQRAIAARPLREQAYAERQRAACLGELLRVDQLEATVKAARVQASQAFDALHHEANLSATPEATTKVLLNDQTCTP